MKLLNKEELKKAEESLRLYFPQSQQAYGYVFMMNRVQADPTDVLVDQWPDFNVLLTRPRRQKKADFFKELCIFSKDESSLWSVLIETDVFDWKQYFCLSTDLNHKEMVKSAALSRGVRDEIDHVCYQMTLKDPAKLITTSLPLRVSSLNESHVDLVNSTWKFGVGDFSENYIREMLKNFPSYCVLDSEGRPVSWILTYASSAMGMLYTVPEHRGKGYAKALITILAKKLHSEGYPAYCFVVEDNQASYRLFTSLGFTAAPSYRAAWIDIDQACNGP